MMQTAAQSSCSVLRKSSLAIRNWLDAQIGVKEESLTDWLLYDISSNSKNFIYKAFTRHEEARKTGADWEWWLVLPSVNIRLRVQAKKLKLNVDHYSDIAYTNRHGLQIQKLLNDSIATNSIPLYVLYSNGIFTATGPQCVKDEGTYIAGGQTIFDKFILPGPRKLSDTDLLAVSRPLSCMFCCPIGGLVEYFSNYFPLDSAPTQGINPSSGQSIRGQHDKLPKYVTTLLDNTQRGVPDWWEEEFRHDLRNMDAILIYDGRVKDVLA